MSASIFGQNSKAARSFPRAAVVLLGLSLPQPDARIYRQL